MVEEARQAEVQVMRTKNAAVVGCWSAVNGRMMQGRRIEEKVRMLVQNMVAGFESDC